MTHTLNCAAFDDQLADYLEDDLGTADRRAAQAHVASCARCTALVRDLERIRSDAGDLPELSPARDLWAGIADRIEAPVVPLAPRTAPNVGVRRRGMERFRLAAVAAALVAVTAGVTYTLTVSRGPNRTGDVAVNTRPIIGPSASRDSTPTDVAQPGIPVDQTVAANDTPATGTGGTEAASTTRASAQSVRNAPASVTYSREIDRLRTIFTQNRSQLDPRTAAIIEANLKVIDDAIAQSKAALAQDPASRFLNNQLNSALDKKLELLRTAALLPNRT